ncbi:amidohydrolase family protein [Chloroflexota bacterium]
MRRIAVEEHFRIPLDILGNVRPETRENLFDLGEGRIKGMDEAGVDMQLLSMSAPGPEDFGADGPNIAVQVNNKLYEAIKAHPKRFAGFAAVAPQYPKEAAKELERSVKELGFLGAKINSNMKGKYIDGEKYWPLFEMAEKLDVPIYLHPVSPAGALAKPFLDHPKLLGANWGLAADAGLQAMRLISGGIFDRHPGLKIFLGHMGEALPFWIWRIDNKWPKGDPDPNSKDRKLLKKASEYIRGNFYFTTSGVFDTPPLVCVCSEVGVDRVLFAVDYPFESQKEAVRWLDAAAISKNDKEKIYYLNAEKIFKL